MKMFASTPRGNKSAKSSIFSGIDLRSDRTLTPEESRSSMLMRLLRPRIDAGRDEG
jgi:hypothetical protein